MKKRIFSLVLALAMMVSVSTAFAAPSLDIEDTPTNVYEGNKPFILMEKILDELNEDKEAPIFDKESHITQFDAIAALNTSLASLITSDLDDAINHLTANMSDAQKMYLYAQVLAIDDPAFKTRLDAVDYVGNLPLRESFGLLDNYIADMRVFLNDEGITPDHYNNDTDVKERARAIVAEPLIAILKVMFAQDGTSNAYDDSGKYMRENYLEQFIANDRAKKTLAVLFGAELTKEIVKDSFLSGVNNSNETIGIVHHVKKYLQEKDDAIRNLKNAIENRILVGGTFASVDASFDVLGELVVNAYDYDVNASDELKADVRMLMGSGTTPGLVECMIKAVDDADYTVSNIWINLLLSKFVQMEISPSIELTTVNSVTPEERNGKISNGSYVAFKNENVSDFGVADKNMNFGTGNFSLKFFAEDPEHLGDYSYYYVTDKVTCDTNGKITVVKDDSQPEEYKAFVIMYRSNDTSDDSTFIESYPVTIVNYTRPSGGGSSKLYITYNTNGGQTIGSTAHTRGSVVELNKVPVREGYIFTGWYSDAALTQKIDSVTVTASTTVYAGWKKDGSAVVSVVDIPELLEGEHHYAYIMGYPEGDVRPYGNITRAETVTMVFRLLKDNVRTSNLTETNSFNDVNESDWFNKAVSTLAAMGIVEGRTETEFMPNANITRAEFATIFARLAEFDAVAEQNYGDVDRHWAEEHIYEASSYGWIAGYEDDTFKPDKAINRAEAMTLVNRVLKRVPESKEDLLDGMTIWSDNRDTSAWYYLAVQEATNSHDHVMKNAAYEKWTVLTENKDWTVFEK